MGLSVVDHLKSMLDGAKRQIGLAHIGAGRLVDPSRNFKGRQHLERTSAAKFSIAPAGNQLLSLHKEFYLANSPTAKLDVVTSDGDRLVTTMIVNLTLD